MDSSSRKQKNMERVRGGILETAQQILKKEGISEVTMRRVAKEMGYSPGSLYNYYKDKEEILTAIYTATCKDFLQGMQRVSLNENDTHQSFIDLVCFMCEFRIRNAYRYREILQIVPAIGEVEELLAIREYVAERLDELGLKSLKTKEDLYIANRTLLAVAEGLASIHVGKVNNTTIKECRQIMEYAVITLIKGWK